MHFINFYINFNSNNCMILLVEMTKNGEKQCFFYGISSLILKSK